MMKTKAERAAKMQGARLGRFTYNNLFLLIAYLLIHTVPVKQPVRGPFKFFEVTVKVANIKPCELLE